jgi:hypothetical protein
MDAIRKGPILAETIGVCDTAGRSLLAIRSIDGIKSCYCTIRVEGKSEVIDYSPDDPESVANDPSPHD